MQARQSRNLGHTGASPEFIAELERHGYACYQASPEDSSSVARVV